MTRALVGRTHAWRWPVWRSWPRLLLVLGALVLSLLALAQSQTFAPAAQGTASSVPLLRVSGPIGPATADYIERGLQKAGLNQAPFVILQIDTPGGLDSSTRKIVKTILASAVPVVAWVAPSGARAASAGAYIVYASHVAVMSPGTNLGAATPVQMGALPGRLPSPQVASDKPEAPRGPDGAASGPEKPADRASPVGDAMTRKIVNDAAAWLRSLAQMRGRNVDWADRAVRAGASLSADEAHTMGVIDGIAADVPALFQLAHGRRVQMQDGSLRTMDTRDVTTIAADPDWRTQLLSLITTPTVAYLLLLFGIYGLYVELAAPGIGVPGVAGAIALLLGLFALQMLPVSYAGVALIVLGFGLMAAEAWLPSFGVLGVGGSIAFVIGSVMLIDTDAPGFGIPMGLIVSVAVLNVLLVAVVLRLALKAHKRPVVSGAEELLGASGEIVVSIASGAWMNLRGERWRVISGAPLRPGQRVTVTGREGLVLQVEPAAPTASASAAGPRKAGADETRSHQRGVQ